MRVIIQRGGIPRRTSSVVGDEKEKEKLELYIVLGSQGGYAVKGKELFQLNWMVTEPIALSAVLSLMLTITKIYSEYI